MQPRLLLILTIVFLLTLLLSIVQSRKRLWARDPRPGTKLFTWRGVFIIAVIILFLFFSLIR
jgi:hypothetical protein